MLRVVAANDKTIILSNVGTGTAISVEIIGNHDFKHGAGLLVVPSIGTSAVNRRVFDKEWWLCLLLRQVSHPIKATDGVCNGILAARSHQGQKLRIGVSILFRWTTRKGKSPGKCRQ